MSRALMSRPRILFARATRIVIGACRHAVTGGRLGHVGLTVAVVVTVEEPLARLAGLSGTVGAEENAIGVVDEECVGAITL